MLNSGLSNRHSSSVVSSTRTYKYEYKYEYLGCKYKYKYCVRPARVYYAARRHVHVRKIFEVLFHSSGTLFKTVNSYILLIDFN